MANATAEKLKNNSLRLEGLVSLFMTAAALGPMLLLLAAGAPLFAKHSGELTFEYWSLLIVLLVLGTAFLVSRVFSTVLARQMRPLFDAAAELSGADARTSVKGAEDPDSQGGHHSTLH